MARVIRARFEGGVLKPLDPLDLREGEIVEVVIRMEDLVSFARSVRSLTRRSGPGGAEPGEVLSRERGRLE